MFHCPLLLRVPPYTTLGEMVCSSWSQSGYLDFQTLSCLNVATVFHRSWLISAGRYLIGSSAPRVPLSHTAQQSEAPELETSAENKKREREKEIGRENVARPYLSSTETWVSTPVFSIRAMCHTTRKRRWWETKQTAVLVENWSWYWNCIIQAGSRWGKQEGWPGERYACANVWKNTVLALAQLASTHLNLYSQGETSERLSGSAATCRYSYSALKWTSFCKLMCTFH